jgi:hypothetical protein
MQVQFDVPFEQILKMVKGLPEVQKKEIRKELDNEGDNGSSTKDLKALLLKGPVATKEDLAVIESNRKSINQWRTK